MFYQNFKKKNYFEKDIFFIETGFDIALFWSYTCVTFHILIDKGDSEISLVYLILGFPAGLFLFIHFHFKKEFKMLKRPLSSLNSPKDVERYYLTLIQKIRNIEKVSARLELDGLLSLHRKTCDKEDCSCIEIKIDKFESSEVIQQIKFSWYKYCSEMLKDLKYKFAANEILILHHIYLDHYILSNKYRAIEDLMFILNQKSSFDLQFQEYRLFINFEEEMQNIDRKRNSELGGNINKMLVFLNRFKEFKDKLEICANLIYNFWRELLESSPDVDKIEAYGRTTTKFVKELVEDFEELKQLQSSHKNLHLIYANFLKKVLNSSEDISKFLPDNKTFKFSELKSSKTEFVTFENREVWFLLISGELETFGIIQQTNDELLKGLKFDRIRMIGESINTLMPKIFGDIHNQLLLEYLQNSDSDPISFKNSYAMNSEGYLRPCQIYSKILPDLSKGIKLAGFLLPEKPLPKKHKEECILLYCNKTGIIQGITENCNNKFGISSDLVFGSSELNIYSLFPQLRDEDLVSEMKQSWANIILNMEDLQINKKGSLNHIGSVNDFVSLGNCLKSKEFSTNQNISKEIQVLLKLEGTLELCGGKASIMTVRMKNIDELGYDSKFELVHKSTTKEKALEQEKGPKHNDSMIESNSENATEMKKIKEAKSELSREKYPKNVTLLNRIFLFVILLLILINLSIFYVIYRSNSTAELYTLSIKNSFEIPSRLAEINYYCRKLNLIAK